MTDPLLRLLSSFPDLLSCVTYSPTHISSALTFSPSPRLEREQAVALRQEQDTAYQASLRADREKARLRQQALQREEEDALKEQRREQDEKDRKQSMKDCIPQVNDQWQSLLSS